MTGPTGHWRKLVDDTGPGPDGAPMCTAPGTEPGVPADRAVDWPEPTEALAWAAHHGDRRPVGTVPVWVAQGRAHVTADCRLLGDGAERHDVTPIRLYEWAEWCGCIYDGWSSDTVLRHYQRLGKALVILAPAVGHLTRARGIGELAVLAELWACASRVDTAEFADDLAHWALHRLGAVLADHDPVDAVDGLLGAVLDDRTPEMDFAGHDADGDPIGHWHRRVGILAQNTTPVADAARRWRDRPATTMVGVGEGDRWAVMDGTDLDAVAWAVCACTGQVPGGRVAVALPARQVHGLVTVQRRRPAFSWLGGAGRVVDGGSVDPAGGDPALIAALVSGLDGLPGEAAPGTASAILRTPART